MHELWYTSGGWYAPVGARQSALGRRQRGQLQISSPVPEGRVPTRPEGLFPLPITRPPTEAVWSAMAGKLCSMTAPGTSSGSISDPTALSVMMTTWNSSRTERRFWVYDSGTNTLSSSTW